MGIFHSLGKGLEKTRKAVFGGVLDLFSGEAPSGGFYDQLEEQLILADVGAAVAEGLVSRVHARALREHFATTEQVQEALKAEIVDLLRAEQPLDLSGSPAVLLIIGVNGVGKTTSIAKLANLYSAQGRKVLLAAADTFRAAAAEQLSVWAERANVPIIRQAEGADPASVVYDAISVACARGYDLVICDTAGRLHNKKNLMDELGKIVRVIKKASDSASVETLLVLDAVTGQNAISQATEFISAAGATGIVLTKLDGTAKGGSVLSIKQKLGLPVRFVGLGEGIDDLQVFDPEEFANALFLKEES